MFFKILFLLSVVSGKRTVLSFYANPPFLTSLKTLESQRFSKVFRGCKDETLCNGLKSLAKMNKEQTTEHATTLLI